MTFHNRARCENSIIPYSPSPALCTFKCLSFYFYAIILKKKKKKHLSLFRNSELHIGTLPVGICLPVQETWVWPLVWEDSMEQLNPCSKPVLSGLWATTAEAEHPRLLLGPATREASTARSLCVTRKSSPRAPQLESARAINRDPAQPETDKQRQLKITYKLYIVIVV